MTSPLPEHVAPADAEDRGSWIGSALVASAPSATAFRQPGRHTVRAFSSFDSKCHGSCSKASPFRPQLDRRGARGGEILFDGPKGAATTVVRARRRGADDDPVDEHRRAWHRFRRRPGRALRVPLHARSPGDGSPRRRARPGARPARGLEGDRQAARRRRASRPQRKVHGRPHREHGRRRVCARGLVCLVYPFHPPGRPTCSAEAPRNAVRPPRLHWTRAMSALS